MDFGAFPRRGRMIRSRYFSTRRSASSATWRVGSCGREAARRGGGSEGSRGGEVRQNCAAEGVERAPPVIKPSSMEKSTERKPVGKPGKRRGPGKVAPRVAVETEVLRAGGVGSGEVAVPGLQAIPGAGLGDYRAGGLLLPRGLADAGGRDESMRLSGCQMGCSWEQGSSRPPGRPARRSSSLHGQDR